MNAISVRDARALLDVACAIEYDSARGAFGRVGLTALCELLEADWVYHCDQPATARDFGVKCEVETRPFAGHNAELEAIFVAHHHEFALDRTQVPGDGVLLLGDVTTDRVWRRSRFYNLWCREVHLEPQGLLCLSTGGSFDRLKFDLADDARRVFGQWERTLLKLIRPAFLQPLALARAVAEHQRALGLTSRELEVLVLVRTGMTNGEIAAELFIAVATVRSHLENAFTKLGVHTRTEAIARLADIHAAHARLTRS